MKKIAVKLALFFIVIVCVSSALSFLVSYIYTGLIKNDMAEDQNAIAHSMLELREKTALSADEIAKITSTSIYEVQRLDNKELASFSPDELKRIHDGEMVAQPASSGFQGTETVIILDDTYYIISLHPHNTMLNVIASRLWLSVLSYVLIGALLVTLFAKRVVEPVIELNLATQEVARGNFDIQVENKSNDEVGELTKNFNKMTRELKNIEYLRKDFISSVSHEFKTPIASIQGFAKLLQKGNLSEGERQEYLNIIAEETDRLSHLSSSILKLSKLENQEIVEKRVGFSLDEQIRKSILLLEHAWSQKNIGFELELEQVTYAGDEELLQQVWVNLLDNAIKFSDINGSISIKLAQRASKVKIEISDQGIGMGKETLQRLFEKFYQGEKAHSAKGCGLGLALVKRILDLHGAEIAVESTLNQGSAFTVELPCEKA